MRRKISDDLAAGTMDRRTFLSLSTAAMAGCVATSTSAQGLSRSAGDRLSLRVEGNATAGFAVVLLFDGAPITASHGEISARFQNGERSLEDTIDGWKARAWSGTEASVTLTGAAYLKNMNATVELAIFYDVVAPGVVRKRIRMRQSDMFMLYHQMTNRMEPSTRPAKYWSFDQEDCPGGALREYFPSAGFRTADGLTVGLLTDAGFRNGWSRMYRRDAKPIKLAPSEIPDPNLYVAATREERSRGIDYIQQTFGEELSRLPVATERGSVSLPSVAEWTPKGSPVIARDGEIFTCSATTPEDGVLIPFSALPGSVYSIQFEYRSNAEIGVALWDTDERLHQLQDFSLFNDRAPASEQWLSFESTVFVPNLRGDRAALLLSLPEIAPPLAARVEIRKLLVSRMPARTRPYHRMEMDKAVEITSFIFAEKQAPDSLRGYRLASQLHLAEALGCRGGDTEKVLYADLMMLCWNAGTETFRPMLAPSIYYSAAGEMYLRDSFLALNGIHNKELNESVFEFWADNQGEDGAINTLIEPEMTNLERKSNDSTPLWLMWALLNQRRFGITPPAGKVRKAASYCLEAYDAQGDGACRAQFVMGQLDIIAYPEGTSIICQNQGLLAVLLRVIRELRISGVSDSISEARILHAEELYRSYYDPERKFILPARDMKDAIGFAELFPEYLSLWLFGRKVLTDEMVVNHLDRIPVMLARPDCPHPELGGSVRPVFIGLTEQPHGWRFFTEHWHPMASDSYAKSYASNAMDGVYYNGGSWMRIEICGYVTGKMHGWKDADKAIKNRLWAEINVAPDFPTSQEYLATDPAHPFFGYHRVFAWNSFVLQALEMAGMRSPSMDPDFIKRDRKRK